MSKRIKSIIITIAIILIVIIFFVSYYFIWGGKPQIKKFDSVSNDYEIIAELSLEYYNKLSSEDEHITLFIYDDYFEDYTNNCKVNLNAEQKDALKSVNEKFGKGCLWVTENSVVFWRDETKYYGLVYSENPLSTIRDMKSEWYNSLEYHRINSNWYEIGVFGI